jgi:serine/threonine protein kinase
MKNKNLYNNKYTKIRRIGEGSFGFVYLVKNVENDGNFTMKKFYLDHVPKFFNF